MPLAAQRIAPPPPEGAMPVPPELVSMNRVHSELAPRVGNLREAVRKAAEMIAGYSSEMATLTADEKAKLQSMADLEMTGEPVKTSRDALDSIRGRQVLILQKVKVAEADQVSRTQKLSEEAEKLAKIEKERGTSLTIYRRACFDSIEDRLKADAQSALWKYFSWMIGAGDGFPRLDNSYMTRAVVMPGNKLAEVQGKGVAVRLMLEAYATGVTG